MSPISNEITANDPLLFAMLTVSERRSDSVSVPGEFEAAEARVKVTPLVIADPLQLVPGKFAQRMVGTLPLTDSVNNRRAEAPDGQRNDVAAKATAISPNFLIGESPWKRS